MKIDVYGNLSTITKERCSEIIINKLTTLAKALLKLKIDINGVNKLPITILVDKITQ
jgi:hypothetical protein